MSASCARALSTSDVGTRPFRRRREHKPTAAVAVGKAAAYCYCLCTVLSSNSFDPTPTRTPTSRTTTTTTLVAHALVLNSTPVRSIFSPRRASPGAGRERSRATGSSGGSKSAFSAPVSSWRGVEQAEHARSQRCYLSRRERGCAGRAPFVAGEMSGGLWLEGGFRNGRNGGRGTGNGMSMSSASGVWKVQDEEEWEFEADVQRLEARLEKAVAKEDYKGAAKSRDELYRMHMDETSAVLSTNSAFYSAFTAKDPDRMATLWMPSEDVMCIHPGDEPVRGHQAVARSWRALFSSGDGRFSSSIIKATEVKIRVRGTTAVVQCNEEVTTGGENAAAAAAAAAASGAAAGAAAQAGGPHQTAASWLSSMKAEIASRAVVKSEEKGSPQKKGGGGGSTRKKRKPRYLNVTNIYRKAGGRWLMVHHHASLPPPPQSNKDLRAAMGLRGQPGEGSEGMSRMFNLSEQGLNMDGKFDDMLESLRQQLPGGSFSLGGTREGSIPTHSMLVIGDDDDDDDEDEEDDDDEEEDDGDDDDDDQDDDEDEQEGQDDSEDGNDDNDDDDDDVDDDDDDGIVDVDATATAAVTGRDGGEWTGSRPVMENLTKKTMKTLRFLGQEEVLSKEEQRRLITDVIHHAAGNQFSAVEVAYELLLGPHSDARQDLADDDSLGDFVEQCKILASKLFDEDRRKKRRRR